MTQRNMERNGPSQRQLRVGEQIRHALAEVFQEGLFHWPDGFEGTILTVTEVRVSPDLRNAMVFVMPLGGQRVDETVKALQASAAYFRGAVAREVTLRYAPMLRFEADRSFDYAARIDSLLRKNDGALPADMGPDDAEDPDETV
jgi:ribosome-binding factor A